MERVPFLWSNASEINTLEARMMGQAYNLNNWEVVRGIRKSSRSSLLWSAFETSLECMRPLSQETNKKKN